MLPFFVAKQPTPIFNRADLLALFTVPLLFDKQHLFRAVEMVAFPDTVFEVVCEYCDHILEVRTLDYPASYPLFVDERFGKRDKKRPKEREKILPHPLRIQKHLEIQLQKPYIWGGNLSSGILKLLTYYPPKKKLSAIEFNTWTLSGVDCSGLIYAATNGWLPRNTKDLLTVGKGIPIAHLAWEEMQKKLRPLDLIVWKGHVCILFDEKQIIESNHSWGGVCLTPISKRLEILHKAERKKPSDDPTSAMLDDQLFLVRRFLV